MSEIREYTLVKARVYEQREKKSENNSIQYKR